jgi:hypothetical protein
MLVIGQQHRLLEPPEARAQDEQGPKDQRLIVLRS